MINKKEKKSKEVIELSNMTFGVIELFDMAFGKEKKKVDNKEIKIFIKNIIK